MTLEKVVEKLAATRDEIWAINIPAIRRKMKLTVHEKAPLLIEYTDRIEALEIAIDLLRRESK